MDARTRLVEQSCRAKEVRVVRVTAPGRIEPNRKRRSYNDAGHKIPHLFTSR